MRKLMLVTLLALAFSGWSAGAAGAFTGNIFVAPNGSDAGSACARYATKVAFPATRTTVCRSFLKAASLSRPGDTILVGNGSYTGTENICRGTNTACSSGSADAVGPAITFLAESRHGPVIHGALLMGDPTGAIGNQVNGRSYVTIDGVDVEGYVYHRGVFAQTPMKYLTLKNMHVWEITSAAANQLVLLGDGRANNVLLDHMELGPACCVIDGLSFLNLSSTTTSGPINFVMQNSQIHDIVNDCSLMRANMEDLYGPCVGTDTGAHIDGMQVGGAATNTKLLNNRWYAINVAGASTGQVIFMSCGDFRGTSLNLNCVGIQIVNNTILSGSGTPNEVVAIGNSFAGSDGIDGTVALTDNTFIGLNGASTSSIDLADFSASAVVKIQNNVGYTGWFNTSGGNCVVPIAAKEGGGNNTHTTFTSNYFTNIEC